MSSYDPFAHAGQLGISVIYKLWLESDGLWVPDHNVIVLRPRMLLIQERCILAHELGHAFYGHRDDRPKHEVQANRWAAERLIDYDELIGLLLWTPDLARVCLELGVTMKIMRTYLNVSGLARRQDPRNPLHGFDETQLISA